MFSWAQTVFLDRIMWCAQGPKRRFFCSEYMPDPQDYWWRVLREFTITPRTCTDGMTLYIIILCICEHYKFMHVKIYAYLTTVLICVSEVFTRRGLARNCEAEHGLNFGHTRFALCISYDFPWKVILGVRRSNIYNYDAHALIAGLEMRQICRPSLPNEQFSSTGIHKYAKCHRSHSQIALIRWGMGLQKSSSSFEIISTLYSSFHQRQSTWTVFGFYPVSPTHKHFHNPWTMHLKVTLW